MLAPFSTLSHWTNSHPDIPPTQIEIQAAVLCCCNSLLRRRRVLLLASSELTVGFVTFVSVNRKYACSALPVYRFVLTCPPVGRLNGADITSGGANHVQLHAEIKSISHEERLALLSDLEFKIVILELTALALKADLCLPWNKLRNLQRY